MKKTLPATSCSSKNKRQKTLINVLTNLLPTLYIPLIVGKNFFTHFEPEPVPLISQRLRIKINAEVVNTVQLVDISIRGLSPSVHPSISALDWIVAEQIQKVYTDTSFSIGEISAVDVVDCHVEYVGL